MLLGDPLRRAGEVVPPAHRVRRGGRHLRAGQPFDDPQGAVDAGQDAVGGAARDSGTTERGVSRSMDSPPPLLQIGFTGVVPQRYARFARFSERGARLA
ncbi:hypothetical protein OHA72_48110 [Dactylosporangium sp. NBC_01737]|uniref:hypothetical protein n=1 Tax=Dactylosporangium sp. NBC_01737 TaxID=2975959 RepID=UPI002E1129DC|nr:hypothetical protein OHA72_48110 [Dactylosporangium sp. NBC_01737]